MSIPTEARRHIDSLLDRIEHEHGVTILFAVESGSRAWGFASPDSDYDVRFVYVRPLDWYLSLRRRRDVIELPIVDDFDVNGWDVRKALGLLVKGHPVLLEWLCSPIVYRERTDTTALRELATRSHHRAAAIHHYQSLIRTNGSRYLDGKPQVPLKKYFYSIRPAAALRWLRLHPTGRVPMDLPSLLAEIDLDADARAAIDDLLAAKTTCPELGDGPPVAAIDRFVAAELALAEVSRLGGDPPAPTILAQAEELFRGLVRQCGPVTMP